MIELSVPHSRPWIEGADRLAVDDALREGMVARGSRVQAFEDSVADYLGASGGVACTSGTAALVLALKALDVRAGDEVILPTYVCWNVLSAICSVDAIPRLCDVDETGVITLETVRDAINMRTRAIIAVHIFGHPCDITSLEALGLPIIEDACQAFGLEVNGRQAGVRGAVGVLSFHATKCMTTGEGGMLVTADARWLDRARALLNSANYENASTAGSMSDIQAALGLAQLKRYSSFLERRSEMLRVYHQVGCQLNGARPGYPADARFLYRYTLHTDLNFEQVRAGFLARGVQIRRGVDQLLHRRLGLDDQLFPSANRLFDRVVSLPFHPSLTIDEQAQVLRAAEEVLGAD